jgi:hypothetical protein
MTFRPKELFQKDGKEREAWQQLAGSSTLQRALAFAQADMANSGFGPNEMHGVNCFIDRLLNLSENDPEQKTMPIKRLKSWDDVYKTAPATPPKP